MLVSFPLSILTYTLILTGTPKERQEVYDRIMRYVDSFPEHNFPETTMISPTTPLPDLQFVLQRIQQRINAKQELQVLQSGLVTSCMALKFGSTLRIFASSCSFESEARYASTNGCASCDCAED